MRPILYYVHHHGLGHWRRALAVAAQLGRPVVFASSLPCPWPLPSGTSMLLLPPDSPAGDGTAANGRLHWAPRHHDGLLARHCALLERCRADRPVLAVVDVSVEIAVLLRTSGIPVVAVRQPGRRDDEPHRLGYDLAEEVLMPVPELWGLHAGPARTHAVGLVGGSPSQGPRAAPDRRHVAILLGAGGSELDVVTCARELPDWSVTVLGVTPTPLDAPANLRMVGHRADPVPDLARAEVIVGNAGLGTVADVAAARRPFVVVPAQRPFDEQHATADALSRHGQAVRLLPGDSFDRAVHAALALGPFSVPVDGAVRMAQRLDSLVEGAAMSR